MLLCLLLLPVETDDVPQQVGQGEDPDQSTSPPQPRSRLLQLLLQGGGQEPLGLRGELFLERPDVGVDRRGAGAIRVGGKRDQALRRPPPAPRVNRSPNRSEMSKPAVVPPP